MLPRCYHRMYAYHEDTDFSHQHIKSLHPNSFTVRSQPRYLIYLFSSLGCLASLNSIQLLSLTIYHQANYDAFSAHLGWCFEHQDTEPHNIRKEWDQWWDSTEGDAWFDDLLVKWGILQDPAGGSKKGSKSYTQRAVDGLSVLWNLMWLQHPRKQINLKPGYESYMNKVFDLITLSVSPLFLGFSTAICIYLTSLG
jgi:hypothetical protein